MDADAWNARYDTEELVWKGAPNQFLPAEVAGLTPGRALDVVDDLAAAELTLDIELVTERAERVDRVVATDGGDRTAIDTLVRARRVDSGPASAAGTGATG